MNKIVTRSTLLSLLLTATGCAAFEPEWKEDMPGFRMQSFEWNHISGTDAQRRLQNRCGRDPDGPTADPWLTSCSFRIREGGQCVVFSLYSVEQAKVVRGSDWMTAYAHERRHCGELDGRNLGGGYTHAGATR